MLGRAITRPSYGVFNQGGEGMNPWEEMDDEVQPRTNLRVKKSIVDLLRRGGKWAFYHDSCKKMIEEIIGSDGIPKDIYDCEDGDYFLIFKEYEWTFASSELEEI